jgi:serine phosphatase RsbU (regulator of sigma subunit)
LFCFTDGFTEGRSDTEFYGEERLEAALDAHECATAADLARLITEDVIAFQRGVPRDDMAAVVLGIGRDGVAGYDHPDDGEEPARPDGPPRG